MLSLYERAVIRRSCMDACKSILRNWTEGRYRAVLDNNIGQLEFATWQREVKELVCIETDEDEAEFNVFTWACFKDECIDYFTGYKTFD